MNSVTIYSLPTCHTCHEVKEFLSKNNISFTDYDVSADQEKQKEMFEKTGLMSVPVTIINDEVLLGFDRQKFQQLLRIQ